MHYLNSLLKMLCSSDELCGNIGCGPSFFCPSRADLNDTMELPACITRSYMTPQRMKLLRKRQSKCQSYIKSKKLDTGSACDNGVTAAPDVVDSGPMPSSFVPIFDAVTTTNPNVQVPDQSSAAAGLHNIAMGVPAAQHRKKIDTLELCRTRKKNSTKLQEKRRHVMESHFGVSVSLQSKNEFVRANETGLQVARPAIYRSSSTACVSPVQKTSLEQSSSISFNQSVNNVGNVWTNGQDCRNYTQDSSYRQAIENNNVCIIPRSPALMTLAAAPSLAIPSIMISKSPSYDDDVRKLRQLSSRQRSKSFGNREVLAPFTSPKMQSQFVSTSDINRLETIVMDEFYNANDNSNVSSSPPSSSSSSNTSSSSLNSPSSVASNVNNKNMLIEAVVADNLQPDRVKKKLKAARKKLKGTKKISKSLHSLFPLGCTGSLTLQHSDCSTDRTQEPIYQAIDPSEHLVNNTNQQHCIYESVSDPKVSCFNPSKTPRRSDTMHVLKSYTRRKAAKTVSADTMFPVVPTHPNPKNTNKNRPSNYVNRGKSKSLKSLSKSNFFSCVATKDLWYNKLAQVIAEEKESTPPTTNIQVSYYDPNTCADICKTVSITSNTNARECISIILDHLEMRDVDVTKFQLWIKSSAEDAPYPLIGHEFPFAIKYNCLRATMQDCGTDQCNNMYNGAEVKCQFILRQERKIGLDGMSPENGGKKVSKKARKSPIRIHKVFKRSNSKGDSIDGPAPAPPGILFGHPLKKLFDSNGSNLPKPVLEMLNHLFQKGPFTVGIFRKSANARLVRELREKLDSGCPTDLNSTNITAVAALLKEFLRSLPDALLGSQLHDEWLQIPRLQSVRDQISQTLLLCSRLPRSNLLLLQHFLCILHHIARRSSQNMMTPSNLAVCVGPSLLWPSSPVLSLSTEASKQAPSVMEFLIDRFGEIFGEAMLRLMGEPPEQDPARQDSGAEESDSLHSGHSLHSCNGRRDDSSIDSLERDLLEGELSPLPRKDKMSLTNLSRDSGLTMSDTQLYTPDEEESESTSSGHSSGDKNLVYPEHRSIERVQHYPAPNNPNAIYTAVCRRPEKSLGYDEHENYYATPSREHTRVHITYSTPSCPSNSMGNKDYNNHIYNHDRLHESSIMPYENDVIYSVPNIDHTLHEPESINSNFQRDDWMRRKSNVRKAAKTISNDGALTRSTSEESLLSKYNTHEYGMSLGAGGPSVTRVHAEDRTQSPATIEYDDSANFITRNSAIRRSRSAHHLAEIRREKLKDQPSEKSSAITRSSSQDTVSWLRSRSTPHIHDGDRSYDSSTLSDDDSTPHVSRSNSRGKDCGMNGAASWDATQTPSDSGNSRNSSFKSERTGSVCTVVSAGSCSTLSSNPPSYEEALSRRSIMQQQQRTGTPPHFNEYALREEKVKSARAKQLYADSLRLYQEEKVYGDIVRASPAHAHDVDELDCPPPLPPKRDPPPLPPKQKASRRGVNDSATRLKHLPPVHVETQCRKQKLSSTSPTSGFGPTMHKTIIYTDVGPPNLPPKERTVIEVVESTSESDRVRQQTVRTVSPPQAVEKKSIETQTDDCDLDDDDDIRDDDSPSSDCWLSDHITSVHVPDSTTFNSNNNQKRTRGRPRRRDSSASQRSRSVPSRDSGNVLHSESDSEDEDWDYATSHEFPSTANYGLRDFRNLEPELRHEISWSVSQLRAIFGESLKGAKIHPPPYRLPPSAARAPITSYHLGAGDAFCRKPRPESSYGEESYV